MRQIDIIYHTAWNKKDKMLGMIELMHSYADMLGAFCLVDGYLNFNFYCTNMYLDSIGFTRSIIMMPDKSNNKRDKILSAIEREYLERKFLICWISKINMIRNKDARLGFILKYIIPRRVNDIKEELHIVSNRKFYALLLQGENYMQHEWACDYYDIFWESMREEQAVEEIETIVNCAVQNRFLDGADVIRLKTLLDIHLKHYQDLKEQLRNNELIIAEDRREIFLRILEQDPLKVADLLCITPNTLQKWSKENKFSKAQIEKVLVGFHKL